MVGSKKGRNVVALVVSAGVVVVAVILGFGWEPIAEWIRFLRRFESLGKNAQGYPEYRHRQTGIIFVSLPGGTFVMGTGTVGDTSRSIEIPHEVSLSPFLIAKYEISQAEWKRIMPADPSHFKGDDLPVENASWPDCGEFCDKTDLSLPTEAQWEYACRAGTSTAYAFGETLLPDQANYLVYRPGPGGRRPVIVHGGKTVPVDSFRPNGFGLYNMHGNVWEWCQDVSDPKFYSKPEARGPDPIATSGSGSRVIRGGGCNVDARNCRSANRGRSRPNGSRERIFVGFRPVFNRGR